MLVGPEPVLSSCQNFFNNAVETDSWLLWSKMDTTSTVGGVGHSVGSLTRRETVGFERQCLIFEVTDDTVAISSPHFLLVTSLSTPALVPIKLVERREHHPIVGLHVARCGTAGAAQGEPHNSTT